MINNKYKFLTYEEQINRLKERNLRIDDEQELLDYLKKYNYENFINNYSTFISVQNKKTEIIKNFIKKLAQK